MAAGDAGTRSVVLKILLGMPDRRDVVRRYIVFSKTLAGWARDRALESMRAFGADLLEPTVERLSDPDQEVRASAMLVAQSFEDPRIVPATIGLLKDPDWWIRITAAETLGRLKDPRGVAPLVEALADPETRWSAVEALGRIADLRAVPALSQMLQDPAPEVRIEVIQALSLHASRGRRGGGQGPSRRSPGDPACRRPQDHRRGVRRAVGGPDWSEPQTSQPGRLPGEARQSPATCSSGPPTPAASADGTSGEISG